ncbi:MAG: hypothetical protein RIT45_593 [Pseudomonadota bacterium]|jgi:hypothetical protein
MSRRVLRSLVVFAALTAVSPAAHALSGIAIRALCEDEARTGSLDAAAAAAARAEGDAAFAKRATAAEADRAIAAYERSLAANPAQPEVRVKLSRAYYLVGDGRGARGYFATYVLTAELYALKVKARLPEGARFCRLDSAVGADAKAENPCRRLYRVMLEHVIKAPNTLPEIAAEQEVEREKARRLLEEIDTFFPAAS